MKVRQKWAALIVLSSLAIGEVAYAAAPPIHIHPIRSTNKLASLYATQLFTMDLYVPSGYTLKAVHDSTLTLEHEQRKVTTKYVNGKWQTQFPLGIQAPVQATYNVTLIHEATKQELQRTFEHNRTGTEVNRQRGVYLTFPH